jgi:hypothetical protein
MNTRSIQAWEEFQQRITTMGGTVLEESWKGSVQAHRCICPQGHECWPRPNGIQQGEGMCMKCRNAPRCWPQFIKAIESMGGTVLEQSWKGSVQAYRCICSEGHECWPSPNSIQQGQGMCVKCRNAVRCWDRFIRDIKSIGGTVLEESWKGSDKPHRCICPNGHECWPYPSNIRNGEGMCGQCAGKMWDVFYIVTGDSLVKLGITSDNPQSRLDDHASYGLCEILFLKTSLPDGLARYAEKSILRELSERDVIPWKGNEYFEQCDQDLILALTGKYMSDSFVKRWESKRSISAFQQ